MWVYHTETLAFLEVNEAAILRYGYSREEFLAMTLADIRPPEDVPRLLSAVRDGGPEPFGASGPWRHLKKDGGLLDVEIASHALRFEGHPARLVLAHDVTERLRAEAELRRFNELLERRVAERMADLVEANRELESFSYSVSHDLRAPLRAVSGFAQILARRHGEGLDEQGRHYLNNIVVAAQRMEVLIEDLLRYSRVGRTMPPPLPVPMDGIVTHLKRVFAARVEASGGALEFLGEFPTPLGDAGTIERVLTNLIENALTYVEAGVPPRVEVSARGDAGEVEIAVRDNGLGVPDEYRERIFEVFQRLHNDEDYPGTGIGLAIVRKAVRAMGGSVTVEPDPEGGSVFRVRLPAAP